MNRKTVWVVFAAALALAIAGAGRAAADVTITGSISGNWTNIATGTESFQTLELVENDTSPLIWGTAPEEDYTFNVTVNDSTGRMDSAMITDSDGIVLATVSSGTGQGVTRLTFAEFKIKLPKIPISVTVHVNDPVPCMNVTLGPYNPKGAGKLVCVGTPIDDLVPGTVLYLAPKYPGGTAVPQVGENSGIYDLGQTCGNQTISASAESWRGKKFVGLPYPKGSQEEKAATACGIAAADQAILVWATANSTPCRPHNMFTFTQGQGTITRQATYGYEKGGNIEGQQTVTLTIQQRGDITVTPVATADVCPGKIGGKCLKNDGTAVGGATVTLTGGGLTDPLTKTTEPDGSYDFGTLEPDGPLTPGNNYAISASITMEVGMPPQPRKIDGTPQPANPQTVVSCQTTTVNFTFQRPSP